MSSPKPDEVTIQSRKQKKLFHQAVRNVLINELGLSKEYLTNLATIILEARINELLTSSQTQAHLDRVILDKIKKQDHRVYARTLDDYINSQITTELRTVLMKHFAQNVNIDINVKT